MDFAKEIFKTPYGDTHGYDFGLPPRSVAAAALRKFADAVESGEILLQEARSITRGKLDDWLGTSLILRYIEKRAPAQAAKDLYAADHLLPVAVVPPKADG